MIKEFDYVDSKGKHTSRVGYVLTKPSNAYTMIDLTEFSEEEREHYTELLDDIMEQYLNAIKEIGLSGNYRKFLEERMSNIV